LAKTLKSIKKEKVHAVFSILRDKDIFGLLTAVKDCIDYWYPAQLDTRRAASEDYLLSLCKKAGILVDICYTSPFIAFEEALTRSAAGDLIVVFGSFFTVSHVISSQRTLLEQKGIL
jgi:dihydrofolate synthase/folylpolyglutamate synthase